MKFKTKVSHLKIGDSDMTLTREDYQNIYNLITSAGGKGECQMEYEKENEILSIEYTYEEEGYVEDDFHCGYMNGTGAWICTYRSLVVDSYQSYNEDGDETENDFNPANLERQAA